MNRDAARRAASSIIISSVNVSLNFLFYGAVAALSADALTALLGGAFPSAHLSGESVRGYSTNALIAANFLCSALGGALALLGVDLFLILSLSSAAMLALLTAALLLAWIFPGSSVALLAVFSLFSCSALLNGVAKPIVSTLMDQVAGAIDSQIFWVCVQLGGAAGVALYATVPAFSFSHSPSIVLSIFVVVVALPLVLLLVGGVLGWYGPRAEAARFAASLAAAARSEDRWAAAGAGATDTSSIQFESRRLRTGEHSPDSMPVWEDVHRSLQLKSPPSKFKLVRIALALFVSLIPVSCFYAVFFNVFSLFEDTAAKTNSRIGSWSVQSSAVAASSSIIEVVLILGWRWLVYPLCSRLYRFLRRRQSSTEYDESESLLSASDSHSEVSVSVSVSVIVSVRVVMGRSVIAIVSVCV